MSRPGRADLLRFAFSAGFGYKRFNGRLTCSSDPGLFRADFLGRNQGRMRIIGIHDGHNAAACLLEDGVITAAIQEETSHPGQKP